MGDEVLVLKPKERRFVSFVFVLVTARPTFNILQTLLRVVFKEDPPNLEVSYMRRDRIFQLIPFLFPHEFKFGDDAVTATVQRFHEFVVMFALLQL
mgnify:CR=1 FL=1